MGARLQTGNPDVNHHQCPSKRAEEMKGAATEASVPLDALLLTIPTVAFWRPSLGLTPQPDTTNGIESRRHPVTHSALGARLVQPWRPAHLEEQRCRFRRRRGPWSGSGADRRHGPTPMLGDQPCGARRRQLEGWLRAKGLGVKCWNMFLSPAQI